jgi:hypothetical protein
MPKKPYGPGIRDAGGNPNQNRKIVQANVQDRAWTETGKKMVPIRKKKLMGTTADQRGSSGKLKGWDYTGSKGGGAWKNPNGVQVGHSYQEDSAITPMKSTGDTASPLAGLQSAIHIHLHTPTDPSANYQKIAAMANKRKRA